MKTNHNKISVLIIDDHALTRFGLRKAFEANPKTYYVAEAENAEIGLKLAADIKPDTVIINLEPPCVNNIKTLRKIKNIDENIKAIILITSNSEEEVMEALRAGSHAHCMKDITPEKLLHVVNFVNDGALWFDPAIAGNIRNILMQKNSDKKLQSSAITVEEDNNGKPQLTERELDVLKLIVDGYSNAEISEKLCVSIHTSKAHVCNILHKLSVDDRTQAAIRALKDGII